MVLEHAFGRVMLLSWQGALDGSGPTPEQVVSDANRRRARFLLLDTTHADYADSNGLRWLIRLRALLEAAGRTLRIVVKPQGKIWRNLSLLQLRLDMYDSVRGAWRTPWSPRLTRADRLSPGMNGCLAQA